MDKTSNFLLPQRGQFSGEKYEDEESVSGEKEGELFWGSLCGSRVAVA